MTALHYAQIWKHYRNNQLFNATHETIVTVYKQARKVQKNQVQNFYHQERKNSIFKLDDLSKKYKDLFPSGLFLCNDSNDAGMSLIFVFPLFDKNIDEYLAQHWHFLLKDVKNGKKVGLHETVYSVPPGSTPFSQHKQLQYLDPISLPTTMFDERYADEPVKKKALLDIFEAASKTQVGGMRQPRTNSTKSKSSSLIQNRHLDKLFSEFETGYKTPGVKMLYVISIRSNDGGYNNFIGYVPRGRVKIQDATSTVIFKTNNTSLLSVRNGLIRRTDQLVRQEGYDYQYDSE
jgi:hypothetical protein